MDRPLTDVDLGQIGKIGDLLSELVDGREEEIVPCCREVMDAVFSDSVGMCVVEALLSYKPLTLGEIAANCDRGRRSINPGGKIRRILERELLS